MAPEFTPEDSEGNALKMDVAFSMYKDGKSGKDKVETGNAWETAYRPQQLWNQNSKCSKQFGLLMSGMLYDS